MPAHHPPPPRWHRPAGCTARLSGMRHSSLWFPRPLRTRIHGALGWGIALCLCDQSEYSLACTGASACFFASRSDPVRWIHRIEIVAIAALCANRFPSSWPIPDWPAPSAWASNSPVYQWLPIALWGLTGGLNLADLLVGPRRAARGSPAHVGLDAGSDFGNAPTRDTPGTPCHASHGRRCRALISLTAPSRY